MNELLEKVNSQVLKEMFHKEIKNAFGHLDITQRLERAYDILVRSNEYTITHISNKPLTFEMANGRGDTYTIIPSRLSCNCPDSSSICKHRIAIKLLLNSIRETSYKTLISIH